VGKTSAPDSTEQEDDRSQIPGILPIRTRFAIDSDRCDYFTWGASLATGTGWFGWPGILLYTHHGYSYSMICFVEMAVEEEVEHARI
jgi:hypothetical protein